MPRIHLETLIDAPRERVFDLARSIDAHQDTTANTGERAVGGVISGLIGPEEEVTWQARHFGINQRLSVRVTKFNRPEHFQDIMVKGAFSHMCHDHRFQQKDNMTLMVDDFDFSAPLGPLGRLAEALFLKSYMQKFIVERNAVLKRVAESDEWKKYLDC